MLPSGRQYPPWATLTDAASLAVYAQEPEFQRVKQEIVEHYGKSALTESWLKVCKTLGEVTNTLKKDGASVIPDISFEEIQSDAGMKEKKEDIRKKGCVIIRGVIPASEASQQLQNLQRYVESNKGKYSGFPEDQPSMYTLYNTPPQNELRSHPNLRDTMAWMNALWDYPPQERGSTGDKNTDAATPDPLIYADSFRIRQPKSEFPGLGPHMDSGGLARWGSPSYRRVYEDIFAGHPERFNAYDMGVRKDADQTIYRGKHFSTPLRAFQGWTALSRNGPREGTILLYPYVATSIAYVLLRPFFAPPERKEDLMDATKWTFDEGPLFLGTSKQNGQALSPSTHPHLDFPNCLLPLPELQAGDTVWWHSDMIHAVDTEHIGDDVASVAYIPAMPNTRINREYARRQYDQMSRGLPPDDFAFGIDESKLRGWKGFEGREAVFRGLMGY